MLLIHGHIDYSGEKMNGNKREDEDTRKVTLLSVGIGPSDRDSVDVGGRESANTSSVIDGCKSN